MNHPAEDELFRQVGISGPDTLLALLRKEQTERTESRLATVHTVYLSLGNASDTITEDLLAQSHWSLNHMHPRRLHLFIQNSSPKLVTSISGSIGADRLTHLYLFGTPLNISTCVNLLRSAAESLEFLSLLFVEHEINDSGSMPVMTNLREVSLAVQGRPAPLSSANTLVDLLRTAARLRRISFMTFEDRTDGPVLLGCAAHIRELVVGHAAGDWNLMIGEHSLGEAAPGLEKLEISTIGPTQLIYLHTLPPYLRSLHIGTFDLGNVDDLARRIRDYEIVLPALQELVIMQWVGDDAVLDDLIDVCDEYGIRLDYPQ